MKNRSKPALWLSFAVFVGVWAWLAVTADAELPGHFDGSGTVTRWDSKWSFLLPMAGVGVAATAVFAGAGRLIARVPGHAINLPSQGAHRYWTSPANRGELNRRTSEDLEWIGAATLMLLAWMTGVSGSTTGDSTSGWALAVPTALYLVVVLGRCVYLVGGPRYRVPRERPMSEQPESPV
ncbi:hypothetical protein [Rhodococcus kronopolitis]|uniref:DUF1648 domain-containing protein n=1 Tax=Rhodococcus kronopolitis TaxID=1460226 RepID=A0ABV9FQI4_9NOCA